MKKIIALILCILAVTSLCACGADPLYKGDTPATADESAAQEETQFKADITNYEKTFDGMQKYLIDCGLLPADEKLKSNTLGELIGAKPDGVRYTLNSSAFIEFYEYDTDNLNDTAKNVLEKVDNGSTFSVAEGLEELTGVRSSSGKLLAVYNANIQYDYETIIKAFEQF